MSLITSIALALGLSHSPAIISGANIGTNRAKIINVKPDKPIKRQRLNKHSQRFLLPVTKQTFKQNQRKERKASARKKARR